MTAPSCPLRRNFPGRPPEYPIDDVLVPVERAGVVDNEEEEEKENIFLHGKSVFRRIGDGDAA